MLYGCVLRKVVLVIFNFMQNMLLLIFAWFFYCVEDVHTGNGITTNLFLEGFFYCCFVSVILDMLFFFTLCIWSNNIVLSKRKKNYQVRWQPFLLTNKTKCWINVYETPEFNNLSAVLYVWSYNLFRCYVLWYWYCKVVLIRTL